MIGQHSAQDHRCSTGIPSTDVTVIIPFYESSRTIGRALESIRSQVFAPAEVIVVDDGSAEAESALLTAIVADYEDLPITVVRMKSNQGPATARNTGWTRSHCAYVAFLDADDSWYPSKLAVQVDALERIPDVAFVGHIVDSPTASTTITRVRTRQIPLRMIGRWTLLRRNLFVTSSVLVRRDVAHRFNVGMRHSEDYDLWLRIVHSGGRAVLIGTPLGAQHKPHFGESGLSADLLAMEKGELLAYRHLYTAGAIRLPTLAMVSFFSVMKYGRRVIVVLARHLATTSQTQRNKRSPHSQDGAS
ncbi:glycosyltransferase family 2 protein [Georgenia wangjunii]|uniref:glycosyltransferase family 2 protein n=1 Tax=Georgenia wangjunii TaxID=3117730 RepID=UPI002F26ABF4